MPKTLALFQGASGNACYDTFILNVQTNSCVLVIVFFADRHEVFAYHWPGFNMSDDGREIIEFKSMYGSDTNPISTLVVYSNYFPDHKDRDERVESVRRLKRECNDVATHYYVNPDGNDNVAITIDVNGLCIAQAGATLTTY